MDVKENKRSYKELQQTVTRFLGKQKHVIKNGEKERERQRDTLTDGHNQPDGERESCLYFGTARFSWSSEM